jgi:hypothetical protein
MDQRESREAPVRAEEKGEPPCIDPVRVERRGLEASSLLDVYGKNLTEVVGVELEQVAQRFLIGPLCGNDTNLHPEPLNAVGLCTSKSAEDFVISLASSSHLYASLFHVAVARFVPLLGATSQ